MKDQRRSAWIRMIRDGPPINVVKLLSVAKLVKQIDARADQQ
jgi:hypothetical protein